MEDSTGTEGGERRLQGQFDVPSRGDLLLVDNDAKIVELLSWFLGERGFRVRVAGSFAEARQRLAEGAPELLISDIDLGVESGLQELPALSAEGALPPTLVVSGFLDDAVQRALQAVPEVLDTLAKPFEFPDLEAKVVACMRGEGRDWLVPKPPPRDVLADSLPSPASDGSAAAGGVGVAEEDDEGWIEISPGG
ncbi:MAG: response regulator [Planctomycetota bacterium]